MSSSTPAREATSADAPLPADHPERRAIANELHARPAVAVVAPAVVSCLALHGGDFDVVVEQLMALARLYASEQPPSGSPHAAIEVPGGRVKCERHGEFTSVVVVRTMPAATLETLDDFPTAFELLPRDWLAALPGAVIAVADIAVVPSTTLSDTNLTPATRWFLSEALAASRVLDGVAWVFTDFVTRSNGRTRALVVDVGMGAAQTARLCQRMVDVEFYRMLGLLAFPRARTLFGELSSVEQQLADLMTAMAGLDQLGDPATVEVEERKALDALTRMAAEVERSVATTVFRFSASQAYFPLVRARIAELREQRVGDLRTLNGFLARRLTPAMETIDAAARRQEALASRIERASALLRTRVDLAREEQNQRLLSAMDRRGTLQLRLQQTVEGLSVAAITYYVVSLLGHAIMPLRSSLPWLDPERASAVSIPIVAYVVWRIIRRTREAHADHSPP